MTTIFLKKNLILKSYFTFLHSALAQQALEDDDNFFAEVPQMPLPAVHAQQPGPSGVPLSAQQPGPSGVRMSAQQPGPSRTSELPHPSIPGGSISGSDASTPKSKGGRPPKKRRFPGATAAQQGQAFRGGRGGQAARGGRGGYAARGRNKRQNVVQHDPVSPAGPSGLLPQPKRMTTRNQGKRVSTQTSQKLAPLRTPVSTPGAGTSRTR